MVSSKRSQQTVLFPNDTELIPDPIPDPTWSPAKFLTYSNRKDIHEIRTRLNRWFSYYPDCKKKEELRKKLSSKNKGNFNGAYVELLSFIFLKSMGSDLVSVDPPDTSDFKVKSNGIVFHVESKSVDGWDEGTLRHENEVVSHIRRLGLDAYLKEKGRYIGVDLYSIDYDLYELFSSVRYKNRYSNEDQWIRYIIQNAGAIDMKLETQIPKNEIKAQMHRVLLGKTSHELLRRGNWCWLALPIRDRPFCKREGLVEVRAPGHSWCGNPQSEAISSTVKDAGKQHKHTRINSIPLVVIVNSRGMTNSEERIIAMFGRDLKKGRYLFDEPRYDSVWFTKDNTPIYSRIGCVIVFDTAQYPAARLLNRQNVCTAYFNPAFDHGLRNTMLGRIPSVSVDINTWKICYRNGIDVGKTMLEF